MSRYVLYYVDRNGGLETAAAYHDSDATFDTYEEAEEAAEWLEETDPETWEDTVWRIVEEVQS